MTDVQIDPELYATLRQLEDTIIRTEGDGLRARWDSGRSMLTLKVGKRLPNGAVKKLKTDLGLSKSEITARMKFAENYDTEEKLTKAIGQFGTWFALKQEGLTDTPRPLSESDPATSDPADDDSDHVTYTPILRNMLKVVENMDSAMLTDKDVDLMVRIATAFDRHQDAILTLQEVA